MVAKAPWGRRGEHPLVFRAPTPLDQVLLRGMLSIPGVAYDECAHCFRAGWDAGWAVARLLGQPKPVPPELTLAHLPGLAAYQAHGFDRVLRDYQKEDVLFAARIPGGVIGEGPRAGKTLIGIALSDLIDARKVLMIGPAVAKWVWAAEIARWTGASSLLLDGRGGRSAQEFCVACMGLGEAATAAAVRAPAAAAAGPGAEPGAAGAGLGVEAGSAAGPGAAGPCPDCRARNGQSLGYRLFQVPVTCARHGHPRPDHPDDLHFRCAACLTELRARLSAHRYVLANFDILIPHRADVGGGQTVERIDLPGWVPELMRYPFDLVLIDEAHLGIGGATNTARRRAMRQLLDYVRLPEARVYALTGTLFDGFTRNGYGSLDIATGGLFGDGPRRFLDRYCERQKGDFGIEADGRSIYADTELLERLKWIKIEHSDAVIFKDTPPIQRQVIRLDVRPGAGTIELTEEDLNADLMRQRRRIHAATREVALLKFDAVLGNVIDELVLGRKTVVFCRYKSTAAAFHRLITKAILKGPRSAALRQQMATTFLATGPRAKHDWEELTDEDLPPLPGTEGEGRAAGEAETAAVAANPAAETAASVAETATETEAATAESVKARFELAARFRAYPGAANITCTYHSMRVSLSLLGARTVHEVEWCDAGTAAQAERRPFGPGVHLSILHYSGRHTIDEHLERVVLPQLETVWRLNKDAATQGLVQALSESSEERDFESVWSRLTRHLRPVGSGVGGRGETGEVIGDPP